MKNEILVCECSSLEHMVVIRYDDEDVYLGVHLTKRSFLDRLKYGIKYIFGYQSTYGAFEEVILHKDHLEGFENIVKELKFKQ